MPVKISIPKKAAFLLAAFVLAGVAIFFSLQRGPSEPVWVKSRHRISFDHRPFEWVDPDDQLESEFRVDWPPRPPAQSRKLQSPPLLGGKLFVSAGTRDDVSEIMIRIQLTRASMPRDRERWNRTLAFPQFDWMSRVRVWDRQKEWLWPNLPFLLRAYGVDRQQQVLSRASRLSRSSNSNEKSIRCRFKI